MSTKPGELHIDCELRRLAKTDPRLKAPQQIYGIGRILACTILAEIGDATRFRRARQVVLHVLRTLDAQPAARTTGVASGNAHQTGRPRTRRAPV